MASKLHARTVNNDGEFVADSKEFTIELKDHGYYQEIKVWDKVRLEEVLWFRDLDELIELLNSFRSLINGKDS